MRQQGLRHRGSLLLLSAHPLPRAQSVWLPVSANTRLSIKNTRQQSAGWAWIRFFEHMDSRHRELLVLLRLAWRHSLAQHRLLIDSKRTLFYSNTILDNGSSEDSRERNQIARTVLHQYNRKSHINSNSSLHCARVALDNFRAHLAAR